MPSTRISTPVMRKPSQKSSLAADEVPDAPREGVQEVDQGEQGEDAGDDAEDRALDELRDLLGHLRLGERDLLADEQLGPLRDVLDGASELAGWLLGHRLLGDLLEDPGEQERARERGGHVQLGLLGPFDGGRGGGGRRTRRRSGPAAAASALGSPPRPGEATAAPETGAGRGGRTASRPRRVAAAAAPRAFSASAAAASAALVRLAPLALLLGLFLLGLGDGLLGLRLLLLGAALVGDGELLAQLGAARLGLGADRVRIWLTREDLPRRRGPKSGAPPSSSRSRPGRPAPRAAPTTSVA